LAQCVAFPTPPLVLVIVNLITGKPPMQCIDVRLLETQEARSSSPAPDR
jgi:hypothetical protein